jgi:hypothetical protein
MFSPVDDLGSHISATMTKTPSETILVQKVCGSPREYDKNRTTE